MQEISKTPYKIQKIAGRGYHLRSRTIWRAVQLDKKRTLDKHLRWMLDRGYVGIKQIQTLRYCIRFRDILRGDARWSAIALHLLRRLMASDANIMWHEKTGAPTMLGDEIWVRFRSRIRKEGALQRIVEGRIVGSVQVMNDLSIRRAIRRAS